MSKIPKLNNNTFEEIVANKVATNKTKIKISLSNLLGEEKAAEIREAAKKLKEKTNLTDDVFEK